MGVMGGAGNGLPSGAAGIWGGLTVASRLWKPGGCWTGDDVLEEPVWCCFHLDAEAPSVTLERLSLALSAHWVLLGKKQNEGF